MCLSPLVTERVLYTSLHSLSPSYQKVVIDGKTEDHLKGYSFC